MYFSTISAEKAVALVVADRRESYPDMTEAEAVAHARNTITLADLAEENELTEAYKVVCGFAAPAELSPATMILGDDFEHPYKAAHVAAERWNGWAIPYFTKDEALKIAADLAEALAPDEFTYDADLDVFVCAQLEEDMEDDEVPTYAEAFVVVPEGRLYSIGGGAYTWMEHKPAPTEADIQAAIALGKQQILADLGTAVSSSGEVMPTTVRTFAELHDYVDANTYGGIADDDTAVDWLGENDASNRVQNALDLWLRVGHPTELAIIPTDVAAERPWFLSVTVATVGFQAVMMEPRPNGEGHYIVGERAAFPTEAEARADAVRFAGHADGVRGTRNVAVVEVV